MNWRTLSKIYDLPMFDYRSTDYLKVKEPEDRIETITTCSSEIGPSSWIKKELKNIVEPKTGIKPNPYQIELYDTIGVAATRVDEALNKLQTAITNNSDICRTNPITVNVDKKEKENNTMWTIDTEYYRKQLEDVIDCASIEIECESRYVRPTIKVRGFAVDHKKAKLKNEGNVPQCKGIIRRGKTTRVDWADGTKTVIVLEEGREDMDMFHTFCIAFTKKMLGSTTKILKTIEECDTDTHEKKRKENIERVNRAAAEDIRKRREKAEKAAFEKAVQQKMFEERVIEEAIRRISIQEERRMNREEDKDVYLESFKVVPVGEVETALLNCDIKEETTDET